MPSYPHHRGPVVGQHIGDYELVSHLARGDMGEVFLAHHPKSGRQLAIKVLDADLCADPQLLQFYEHEVWTVNHLDHPAIVDVVDFGKLDGGRAYLVMKFLRGRSLAEHLAEHGRVSPAGVRDLLLPALEALVAVHGAGVTHKDLKPSNIFLVQQPDGGVAPQLLDTGLAHLKPLAAVPGSAAQLSSKTLPLYKSPEQVIGDLNAVGPWSDIYSAAAVAFHLLAGRPPFIGATAQEVAHQHLHAPPPDLGVLRPEMHPTLAKVIAQGLAKRPADRFNSMEAFLKAFRSASSRPAPTLRGPTAAPAEGAVPVVVPMAAPMSQAGPPPTVHLGPAPRQDRTPPPTMRIDAGQHPMPLAAPAPMAAPPPGAGYYPAVVPTPMAAPYPGPYYPAAVPAALTAPVYPGAMPAAGSAPRRGSALMVVFIVLGSLLVLAVVIGLIIALGSDDEKTKDEGVAKSEKQPDKPMARAVMTVMASQPARVATVAPPAILPVADRYRVDIRNRPWKGAEHARATVVVYCGFAGYYCRSSRDNFRRIVSDYPRDVKLVWMDYPLPYYNRSMPAAVAAAEVFAQRGRAGFWKMHDRLYGNPYHHTDDNLVKWAIEAGADSAKVRAAITAKKHEAALRALMSTAQTLGVSYTPTVFVNGIRIPDANSLDNLKARVESEIAIANKILSGGGVTLKGYYAHTQRNALTRKKSSGLGLAPYKPYKPYKPYASLLSTIYQVPVTPKNPQMGPADALVTVVLFGDFQCPFTFRLTCALRVVLRKRGQYAKDVRLVWMNNPRPYHSRAMVAAEAALEGFAQRKSAGFWALHDRLFPMDLCRPDGGYRFGFFRRRDRLDDAYLLAMAKRSRLSVSRFRRALSKHTHRSRILAEQQLAKGHYASSTPTMFINGKIVTGAKTVSELKVLFDQARRDARKTLIAKRVSKAKLYDTIIATGKKPRARTWP